MLQKLNEKILGDGEDHGTVATFDLVEDHRRLSRSRSGQRNGLAQ
jgi:hypothetical protein